MNSEIIVNVIVSLHTLARVVFHRLNVVSS